MHDNQSSQTLKGFYKLTVADFIVRSSYQMGKTPLLPIFAAALGASDAFLGIIVSVSTLTGMVLKPAIGFLSDLWGRRIWLILGTVFLTFMPLFYWWVETPQHLFWSRLVHGMATAIYGPVTLAYIAAQSRKRLAEKLGWFGLAREGGYIVGPALAGLLLLVWSPQLIFTLIGLLSALAFIPILGLPEPERSDPGRLSWVQQWQQIVKTIRQSASIWFAGGLESLNYIVLYALKAFLPIYALSVGFNVAVVGAFFAVQETVNIVLRPFTGRFGDKFGYLFMICLGMLLLGVSVLGVMQANTVLVLFTIAVLTGVAQALVFPSSLALVAGQVKAINLGLSMGLVGSMANAGKVLGPVLGGLLISRLDYQGAFSVLSLSLMGFVLVVAIFSVFKRLKLKQGSIGESN